MKILLSTTDSIPGHIISDYVGLAWGSSVKSKHIIREFVSITKSFVGGSLPHYSKMLNDSRHAALQDLILQVEKIGGSGVIGLTFSTATISSGLVEICAYGTVVKVKSLKIKK